MSQNPKEIWGKLPESQKREIVAELLSICQEIIYDHIGIDNNTKFIAKSDNLHSAIKSTSSKNQSIDLEITI